MKYYYDQLSSRMKRYYQTILEGVYNLKGTINLYGNVSIDEVHILVESVGNDHCECFWWEPDHYHCCIGLVNTTIHFDYSDTDRDSIIEKCKKLTNWKCEITRAVLQQNSKRSLTAVDKTWLIGNYLAGNMRYSDSETIPYNERHSIWGAYKGAGVCEAISRAFVFLTDDNPALGLDAIYITGYLSEREPVPGNVDANHAWNALIDNGRIYHFDLTQQIMRAHIPLIGASKQLFMKPDDMRNYLLTNNKYTQLFVPCTCSTLKSTSKTQGGSCV